MNDASWWSYPVIDPVALALGPLKIHWYGLMYLLGFIAAWYLGRLRCRKPDSLINEEQLSDLLFYGALGVVVGGRVGYVLFYHFPQFLADPLWLFQIWTGGMSFHGGLLGVILAMAWVAHRDRLAFFSVADFVAPLVPMGLGAGRIGNFIGGELWGRVTSHPIGMVFPGDPAQLSRHPSQLYQFALEGLALFCILWWFSSKPRPRMAVSGLFLLAYGLFRTIVEFFRQPDTHLGFVGGNWLTMGQALSLPMIFIGGMMLFHAYRQGQK